MNRELKVNALSAQEWSYLRGLFLTDGCSFIPKVGGLRRDCRVIFYFGANDADEGMASRVVELMRRAGLNPRMKKNAEKKNMITVTVWSRSLAMFLPDRKNLRGGGVVVTERFLEENGLFSIECGIPFVAGLLDGNGCCQVYTERGEKRPCFGALNHWKWSFIQHKFRFLADYMKRFVERLAPDNTRLRTRGDGFIIVYIRKSGIKALLAAGIDKYSFKVARWLRLVDEARGERRKYLTTGQVARMLNLTHETVWRYLKAGKLRYVRRFVGSGRRGLSWWYISVAEVERFKEEFMKKNEEDERAKDQGVKLADASGVLGVAVITLRKWRRRGRLSAASVREGSCKYLVMPKCEVMRLEHKLGKR